MKDVNSPKPKDRTVGTTHWLLVIICAFFFTATTVSVVLAPIFLERLYRSDEDYSRISDIGQSYGAASAVVSTIALGVVMLGLMVQRRQLRNEQLRALSDTTDELVRRAMDDPVYQQCWGGRIAPEGIEEDLFSFCNLVLRSWKRAWDLGDLTESQVRSYLANFFDSEIPRLFWQTHCEWQMKGIARNRRARLLAIINEEYLRAIRGGPPSRSYEKRQRQTNTTNAHLRHILEAAD